jgi:hypothetical protein
MRMTMTVVLVLAGLWLAGNVLAADAAPQQIVLTILTPQINAIAPGIDAAVVVTPEQANALAAAYREVFQSSAVTLANMVLQDANTSMAQRQLAAATIQQAQTLFQGRARAVFTPAQRQLVDKVQAAYTRIFDAAQAQMVTAVKNNFTTELDTLLTAEQKQAMLKARAEIDAAKQRKAAEQKPAATPVAANK